MRFAAFCFLLAAVGLRQAARAEPHDVVHMLVPGFTVQELPVRLSNINNLRFAPDGRLFALAYDGRIHVLRDTNGDGLEDRDEIFWDKSTLTVPVGMAISRDGVYVSSHGKVSLLRDTDGDGRADREDILATNWPPTDVSSGGVDATGVTLDRHGALYFALITADYSNPYRVADGRAHYDLNGKRGTIQKLWPRTGTMETVATGLRVPYTLAFNRAGDLFCTDQEGETWCPDGNPLDELNHIVPGRNYGFPPRHEKWLPALSSEPPVVAFGPQHQSTCGLVFNEPRKGQGLFGPKWWEGDAFIAGESRGKLWRVRLVKTARGYIGKEFLIARLSMLTTDVAISPRGALYVSCHSGQPDWGTGPQGQGRIFKISYTDPKAPQPVLAWASDATDMRIAFDKPLDPHVTETVVGQSIEFGQYVRAADRFEVLRPPYKVLDRQLSAPRGRLRIVAALMPQPHILSLATDPHPQPVTYALTLAGIKAPGAPGSGTVIDLDYDLTGDLSLPEQHSLVRGLPHGSQIADYLPGQPFVSGNPPKAAYPFIHPQEEQEGKELALEGGDYERGRDLFFNERLKCATCHRIRGEGGALGPDLSNLPARDAASVLRDIKEPGASIHPDYVAYNLALTNGTQLNGFVRAQDQNSLRLLDVDGKETLFRRTEVKDLRPSPVSLMPTGLLDGMKDLQVRDLLTFLLNAPPVHVPSEVEKALASAPPTATPAPNPLRIVLVASKQDHCPVQHDYPAWQKKWHTLLTHKPWVRVDDAWLWPTPDQFQQADVLVFYYWNRAWDAGKLIELDQFLARGKGVVALHSATIGNPNVTALAERIGLASESGRTKYLHTPVDLKLTAPTNHPIMRGLSRSIHFVDEPYWPMVGDTNKVNVLATTDLEEKSWPIMWTFEKGPGRVFVSIFGHYTWTLDDPLFRLIVLRAIEWASGRPAGTGLERLALEMIPDSASARSAN